MFWVATFFWKTYQASLYLIFITDRLHDANEPLAKGMLSLRLCPDLPIQQKPGYLDFCEMCVFPAVRLYCKHIFENNKLNEIEHSVMHKKKQV